MSEPFAWLHAPRITRLAAALGWPRVDVRFVGGCVRDSLAGRPFTDVDLGTPETPDAVLRRLDAAGLKAIPTGIDHGTVTAVLDGMHAEITTLRRDTACDGRHAAVEFGADWREDARRRDFTINAMSLSPDGVLHDEHGGRDDLAAGRVRFVGTAADRIREDYLRVLRLFRFQAHFGRLPLDARTLDDCARLTSGLSVLSAERVHQEVRKLLGAPDPAAAVAAMAGCGVLAAILPEADEPAALRALVDLEHTHQVPATWTRRFAVLLSPDADVRAVAQRLALSGRERAAVTAMLRGAFSREDFALLLYRDGRDAMVDRTLVAVARGKAAADLLAVALAWRPRPMPIGGDDLLRRGLAGPAVGRGLRRAEALWVASGFAATPDELLAGACDEGQSS